MIYQCEKTLKESGDKIDADSKRSVEDAIAALKTSLEGSDVEDIKAKTEAPGPGLLCSQQQAL